MAAKVYNLVGVVNAQSLWKRQLSSIMLRIKDNLTHYNALSEALNLAAPGPHGRRESHDTPALPSRCPRYIASATWLRGSSLATLS